MERKKFVPYRSLGSEWGSTFDVDAEGVLVPGQLTNNMLILSALFQILASLERTQAIVRNLDQRVAALMPDGKPDPALTRERHILACRQRSMAAYLKALGKATCADGILDKEFRVLNLTVRARKCCLRLDVKTVGDLCQYSAEQLLETKHTGQSTLNEIRGKLARYGLFLVGEEPDDVEVSLDESPG